jgi:hypothetical protein
MSRANIPTLVRAVLDNSVTDYSELSSLSCLGWTHCSFGWERGLPARYSKGFTAQSLRSGRRTKVLSNQKD